MTMHTILSLFTLYCHDYAHYTVTIYTLLPWQCTLYCHYLHSTAMTMHTILSLFTLYCHDYAQYTATIYTLQPRPCTLYCYYLHTTATIYTLLPRPCTLYCHYLQYTAMTMHTILPLFTIYCHDYAHYTATIYNILPWKRRKKGFTYISQNGGWFNTFFLFLFFFFLLSRAIGILLFCHQCLVCQLFSRGDRRSFISRQFLSYLYAAALPSQRLRLGLPPRSRPRSSAPPPGGPALHLPLG